MLSQSQPDNVDAISPDHSSGDAITGVGLDDIRFLAEADSRIPAPRNCAEVPDCATHKGPGRLISSGVDAKA